MGCASSVRGALSELPGVTDVTVDVASKTATCSIDPETFDQQAALDALKEKGFPGKVK
ncbi:MAG: heavy metal-associated domain-containing protein [Pirellulaceae bacterium]